MSSQLQVKYNENLTDILQSRVLENLQKFDKGNNAAGTRARVASQDLIKMLKSLRVDVLTVQKDKKALKAEGKTTPKDNSPVSEVVEKTDVVAVQEDVEVVQEDVKVVQKDVSKSTTTKKKKGTKKKSS